MKIQQAPIQLWGLAIIGLLLSWVVVAFATIHLTDEGVKPNDGFFGRNIEWCERINGQSRWSIYNPNSKADWLHTPVTQLSFGASIQSDYARLVQVVDPDDGEVVGLFCERQPFEIT